MAFQEGGNDGTISSTSPVTIVSGPSSGRRIVKYFSIYNPEANGGISVSIRVNNNSSYRRIWSGTLDGGDTFIFGDVNEVIVLDSSSKSIEVVLGSTPTSALEFVASWGDAS